MNPEENEYVRQRGSLIEVQTEHHSCDEKVVHGESADDPTPFEDIGAWLDYYVYRSI